MLVLVGHPVLFGLATQCYLFLCRCGLMPPSTRTCSTSINATAVPCRRATAPGVSLVVVRNGHAYLLQLY